MRENVKLIQQINILRKQIKEIKGQSGKNSMVKLFGSKKKQEINLELLESLNENMINDKRINVDKLADEVREMQDLINTIKEENEEL